LEQENAPTHLADGADREAAQIAEVERLAHEPVTITKGSARSGSTSS
jgi:hypothetical protein